MAHAPLGTVVPGDGTGAAAIGEVAARAAVLADGVSGDGDAESDVTGAGASEVVAGVGATAVVAARVPTLSEGGAATPQEVTTLARPVTAIAATSRRGVRRISPR